MPKLLSPRLEALAQWVHRQEAPANRPWRLPADLARTIAQRGAICPSLGDLDTRFPAQAPGLAGPSVPSEPRSTR